jgi:hypothetical protein
VLKYFDNNEGYAIGLHTISFPVSFASPNKQLTCKVKEKGKSNGGEIVVECGIDLGRLMAPRLYCLQFIFRAILLPIVFK